MSPPYPGYSQTLQQSKETDVFDFEVEPYKSNLVLDSGLKLKVEEAWVEHIYSKQVLVIGKTMITKGDGHQIILKLDVLENNRQRTNKFYYFLGTKSLNNYVHYPCTRIDTIRVPVYRETWPTLSSKKSRRAFDSLTFIRRQTSH